MRRPILARGLALAGLILTIALGLAACGGDGSGGGGGSGANTITMGGTDFNGTTDVTIKAGQAVTFDDSNGGSHHLVTGSNGTFSQEAGAPSEFGANGTDFNPGDTKSITFATAGTYHITCTFHPSMAATVTVTS
ncbi:MAG TPA: plastocyanin/azurin family copper-binding protein [Ktedonobacterales bacterium]|jgi:plastocyanin|nr:plastocyanin/azurin family copper-binding protein [Ktedonobacterales bacterium]